MPFFGRGREPAGLMTGQELSDFGRWQFLRDESRVDPAWVQSFVPRVIAVAVSSLLSDRSALIAELRHHATAGEWERIGAWQVVREFMDETPETLPLIDGGMLALARMRVTNLRHHLAPVDLPHYERVTGTRAPHDGFTGPPVFDSRYGPSRQYYFDEAIAVAAARTPSRIRSSPGVEPGPVDEAAKAMWGFGLLVHRGPRLVSPTIAFEPVVLRPAILAATQVDHLRFAELLVEKTLDERAALDTGWPA
jgi:hypothetical protein